jgi:hypothetical protein
MPASNSPGFHSSFRDSPLAARPLILNTAGRGQRHNDLRSPQLLQSTRALKWRGHSVRAFLFIPLAKNQQANCGKGAPAYPPSAGIEFNRVADLRCNECGAVIRTVPAADIEQELVRLAMAGGACGARCSHCGALQTFPGFDSIDAFVCRECGGERSRDAGAVIRLSTSIGDW